MSEQLDVQLDDQQNDSRRRSDELRDYERDGDSDRGSPAGIGSTAQPDPARAQPDALTLAETDYISDDEGDVNEESSGDNSDNLDRMITRDAVDPMSSNSDVLDLPDDLLLDDTESGYNMGFGDPDEDVGTTDAISAIEDGLTYFAPVDPVITSATDDLQGAVVSGGFATSSGQDAYAPRGELDAPLEPDRQLSDDDLAEAVVRALLTDSYTSDLPVEVTARNGTVYLHGQLSSYDEAEQVMAVAGEVNGVIEVNDDELDY